MSRTHSPQLTEDEKNKLVIEHKGIIHYMANRYRHLDNDIEELEAWAYFGFAIALDKFEFDNEKNIELSALAFSEIRSVISSQYYYNASNQKSEASLDGMVTGSDGDNLGLEGIISGDDYRFDAEDIMRMLDESLFEEQGEDKDITTKHFFHDKPASKLSKEYKRPLLDVRRIIRTGQRLMKLYLSNNDIISDYLLYPKGVKDFKRHEYKRITIEDFRRIKYIRRNYPYLKESDIAYLLDREPYVILQTYDYPTVEYLRCTQDDSIANKVETYCKVHYPEQLPSEVKVYETV